jgi:hypothetical protein
MASPEKLRDWPINSLAKETDLECRCDHPQVLSRGLTFAGSGHDSLYVPTAILPVVCVEECSLIGLNTLQRQRVLILSGRTRCKGTQTDNSQSYEHCRDQAFGDLSLELFHKAGLVQVMLITVNKKNKNLINGIDGRFRQFCAAFNDE